MFPHQSTLFRNLQWALVLLILLGGASLLGLYTTSLFGIRSLAFLLCWYVHCAVHLAVVTVSIIYLVRLAQELSVGGLYFYLALFFLVLCVLGIESALPWTGPLAIGEDLALVRTWISRGQMAELPNWELSYLPAGIVPVYVGMFVHHFAFLATLYHVSYLFPLSALVASFVFYKTQDEEICLWSSLLTISCPLIFSVAVQPSHGVATALYFGLAYVSALFWGEQKKGVRFLLLSGLALGFSIFLDGSMLFIGFVFLVSLFGFFVSWKISVSRCFLGVGIIGVVAAAGCSVWLFRNFIWYGNALYPLVGSKLSSLVVEPFPQRLLPGLVFSVLGLVPVFRPSRNMHRVSPWARSGWFLVFFGALSVWTYFSRNLFHLMPLVVVLIILSAAGLEQVLEKRQARERVILIRGSLIAYLFFAVFLGIWSARGWTAIDYFFLSDSRQRFLEEQIAEYAVAKAINQNLPKTARVFFVNSAAATYYVKRPIQGSSRIGEFLKDWVADSKTPVELARQFFLYGITHLVVNMRGLSDFEEQVFTAEQKNLWRAFLLEQTEDPIDAGDHRILRVQTTAGLDY